MSKRQSRGKTSKTSGENRRNGKSVEELTEQNVDKVSQLEESAREQRTSTDRMAEAIANFCGSMTFVWVHVVWFGGWIVLNLIPGVPHFDQFPFTFLTLVVSLEAIFLSTFILISQNLETRISERRSHLDLQLNMLSEQENTKMLLMLEQIGNAVGAEIGHIPDVKVFEQPTQPEALSEQIDQAAELDE